MSALSKSDINY